MLPSDQSRLARTYCNPIPLPDYPRGRASYEKSGSSGQFRHDPPRDFRETADPTVIYHAGKWYLYPSCGMAYVSEDFVTWRHIRLQPYDAGYAPTVVVHRDRFLLTACDAPLYAADNPLGPFAEVGPMLKPDGTPVEAFNDPMLFADEDGHLYAYWGLGAPGIFGAELDPAEPNHLLTEPRMLFSYDPAHVWERYGAWNEDPSKSYVEGSWMIKHEGRYFLTYAAPGTEWRTYGMGTYVAQTPLGPFRYQPRNPILAAQSGLIRGPGHGCLVKGPNDTLWAFYTCTVCYEHIFERRIGLDPAGIDADGNLFVRGPSEIPQWAPGLKPDPQNGNDAAALPLTLSRSARASSEAPGRPPLYAVDGSMLTFWEPAADDPAPTLTVDLQAPFEVAAVRVIWKDLGLDYDAGAGPGPFQYRVELQPPGRDNWVCALNADKNDVDLLIDYRPFPTRAACRARLVVTGCPESIRPGVIDFTVFGAAPAPA